MRYSVTGLLLAGCAMLSACNASSGPVGTYIGGDDSAQVMVQITNVKDHELRGTITAVTYDNSGKVAANSRPLSGTVDSKLLNLTVENGTGLSLLTGTMTDRGLELTGFTGEKSATLILERRDATEFASRLQGVRRHAAELKLAAEQDADHASRLRRLSGDQDRISAFAAETMRKADDMAEGAAKIDAIVAGYRRTADQAGRLGATRAKLAAQVGNDDSRVEQVAYERQQNADAATSEHEWTRDALQSLNENSATREQQAASMQAQCTAMPELDCSALSSAMSSYRVRAVQFRTAAMRESSTFASVRPKF